jgi:hypothetical protein
MSDLQVLLEGHAASVGVQLEETPIVSIPANIFRIQYTVFSIQYSVFSIQYSVRVFRADPDQALFKEDPDPR